MRFTLQACLVFLALSVSIISCSTMNKSADDQITKMMFLPSPSFDESTYINPEKYGYKISQSRWDFESPSDSVFVPISLNLKRAQMRVNYPAQARRNGIQGKVTLKVFVDSTGKLTNMRTISSHHDILSNASMKAASDVKYKPATLNGEPVNSYKSYTMFFQMRPSN